MSLVGGNRYVRVDQSLVEQSNDSVVGTEYLRIQSEDWYFCSHRLDLGTSLVEAGAEVAAAHGLVL